MILSVERHVHGVISDAIRTHFGIAEAPPFAVEVPPNRALGDLAVPVAFQLARTLRKAPRAIAQELASAVGTIPGVGKIVAAPNGYLNLYLDRAPFLLPRFRGEIGPATDEENDDRTRAKTIVEHTAINPNKAAHIGHLRNAVLGDTLARVLRFRGTPIEVQNYIDDLGVQVADIIVGFRELEHRDLAGIRQMTDNSRFDYYCWDLYSRVTGWYEEDRANLASRARTLHELEEGVSETAQIGALIVDRIVRAHLTTMTRLSISYDLLTYEGDIVRLKFWAHAFETLKARGAIYLQTEGKLAGCWVMRIEEAGATGAGSEPSQSIEPAGESIEPSKSIEPGESIEPLKDDAGREKVIVRSNGVVTYIGKDLANQFWKLGLLGLDFRYRSFGTQADGRPLWSTTSESGDRAAPQFGRASRIVNVIDSRQMYLQALLRQALRTLGHATEAENSIHLSYEMVALSHAT
ncbi:MAG TPA: arginine--tRNA ligase, partial [Vicinamibacterales bacterium]|nr:arginine--tRNA ligase [Vicinamibacterales bacterium]